MNLSNIYPGPVAPLRRYGKRFNISSHLLSIRAMASLEIPFVISDNVCATCDRFNVTLALLYEVLRLSHSAAATSQKPLLLFPRGRSCTHTRIPSNSLSSESGCCEKSGNYPLSIRNCDTLFPRYLLVAAYNLKSTAILYNVR